MLDFMQDLKEERIKGIKTGFYVPIAEQGHAFYQIIHHGDYAFELNGKCYRQTRDGNEYDLKEIEKRKVIEKLYTTIENKDLNQIKECFNQDIDVNFIDCAR